MPVNAFGISKADWKNIEQRKIDSRNARRGKRQGAQAVGIGAAVAGAGAGAGGVSAAKAFADRGKNSYKTSQVFSPNSPKSLHLQNAARTVGRSIKLSPKSAIAAGATVGGAALAAGGAAKFGVGLGKEKHAEKKIAQMRKQRALKVSKSLGEDMCISAFGVTHEGISKADIPTQEGYKKAKLASAGKNNVQVRRGTYGKRIKGRLKDQVPAMAVDAAATGGQLALMRKSPKTALAVGTASLGASYGLTVRGAKRSANREIKNKDIVVTDKKTGKKAIGTGYLTHKFE